MQSLKLICTGKVTNFVNLGYISAVEVTSLFENPTDELI